MTDDEKRESLKTAGLPPHIINEILRAQHESEEHGEEAYRYVKEIMSLEENQIARTLFNAFWRAIRQELKGLKPVHSSAMLALISMCFTDELKKLMDETDVGRDQK
jgi:isocitrate/isopropylmalate dehydrogenase